MLGAVDPRAVRVCPKLSGQSTARLLSTVVGTGDAFPDTYVAITFNSGCTSSEHTGPNKVTGVWLVLKATT